MEDQNKIVEENNKEQTDDPLKDCERMRDEYLAGWQRERADLANYKKEEIERVQAIAFFSNEQIIRDLLPLLDSFELGIVADKMNTKESKGMIFVKTQFEDILKRHGVEKIKISIGDTFNPMCHEATNMIESHNPPDSIVEIIASGYTLYDKVLRPARVILSKGQQKK